MKPQPQLPTDDLFQIERRIAQRADDISRQLGVDRGHALEHWRQAEREVWGEQQTDLDARTGTELV